MRTLKKPYADGGQQKGLDNSFNKTNYTQKHLDNKDIKKAFVVRIIDQEVRSSQEFHCLRQILERAGAIEIQYEPFNGILPRGLF